MESPLDIVIVCALGLLALAFVVWRFALTKKPPACATGASDGKPPPVILGSNLAKGMAAKKGGVR